MDFSGFLQACREAEDVHLSHAVVTDGEQRLASHCEAPYRWDSLRLLFSVTKSFASLAVGIAWDLGLLGLDDLVADWLRDQLPPKPHPNVWKLRVRHVLAMTAGMHENTYEELLPQKDWVQAYLAQEFPHEPGFYYRYSTHGSHLLSALVQRASGQTLEEFLNERLFFPMGIREARWERSPEGLTAGGMGLRLSPGSLEKVVRLLLCGGVWNGRRLVSAEYLAHAAFPQAFKQGQSPSRARGAGGDTYGFQFHLGQSGTWRMDGAFGQLCLIAPRQGLGLVALSQNSRMDRLLELAHGLLSSWEGPGHAVSQEAARHSRRTGSIPAGEFRLEENPLGAEDVSFREQGAVVFCRRGLPEDRLEFRAGQWTYGRSRFIWDLQWGVQEHAVFLVEEAEDRLDLEVRYLETPYVVRHGFRWEEERLVWSFGVNAGFTLHDFTVGGTKA